MPRPLRLAVFANFLKINDESLAAWAEILRRAPGARLVLQDTLRAPARAREMARRLREAGLPLGRVEARLGSDAYLAQLAQMDLVLDNFPYPGGAMTATALYLGVPVVTLAGGRHSARLGASLLTAAGLPQLIAASEAEYIEKAVALAQDRGRLMALRQGLAAKIAASPLCDREAYVKAWGAWLKEVCRQGQAGL